jgi:phosphinothricin acetyltransferase
MKVERPTCSSFLEISELDRTAWSENRNSEYIPDGEHIWRLWVEFSSVYVVINEGRIIAAAIMFSANSGNLMLLHKVFVKSDFMGRGVGSMLFERITSDLDNDHMDCMLTTDPINIKMIKICEKYKFTERHLVKSYYRKEEDRYVIYRRHDH